MSHTHSKTTLLFIVAALSLLATTITACCGFYLARIALEQHLLQAQTQNLSTIVTSLRLPLTSQRLLANLKQVSNCDVVITSRNQVLNATLPELIDTTFQPPEDDDVMVINSVQYRLASQAMNPDTTLWLLLPSSVFTQGLQNATKPIAILAAIAALLAVFISLAIANTYASLLAKSREADRRLAKAQHVAMAGKLSASVVHELRNPLSGIKMNAQILADELPMGTTATEPLDMILSEIDRIDQFLKGLTAMPEKDITPAEQDTIQNILQEAMRLLQKKAGQAAVNLHLLPVDKPDQPAPCNPLHLRQILVNLMANAIDASPKNATVTVAVTPTPLTISVQDQGPGVHPKDGEDIFAPFVSQKENGFGLGLHISQEIAAKYHAAITWENLSPVGAKFSIRFPA